MRKNLFVLAAVTLLSGMLLGCGGKEPAGAGSEAVTTAVSAEAETTGQELTETDVPKGGVKTFTIYNCAGAPGYHEQVVLAKFQEKFGDKYDVKYETLSGADIIAKIEAQGYQAGDGNINIVMSGDTDIVLGLEAGVWADLSEYEDKLKIKDLTDLGRQVYDAYDAGALPITMEPSQPAVAYMPETEMGKIIDGVVGDDGAISYPEILKLLADHAGMKLGRGMFPGSGPGDIFTYGMFSQYDDFGADAVPQNTINMFKPAYENKQVLLYSGTGASFQDMTDGNTDIVPHTLSWFFRLYALKLAESTLPEELRVDALGLENAKFAYIVDDATGEPLDAILTNHCYLIPANLSDEDMAASVEFLEWATSPEIQACALTVLAAPSYKTADPSKIEDENTLLVWTEVAKYYPEQFLEDNNGVKVIKTTDRTCLMPLTDVGITATYKQAWQEQLESFVSE